MRLLAAHALNALVNFGLGLLVAFLIGPAAFGAYALILAGAALLQVIAFEWIRLAAVRFHAAGEKGALQEGVEARLSRAAQLLAGCGVVAGVVLLAAEWLLSLPWQAAGLAPIVAVASGLFDYRCGLVRAEFDDRRFVAIVLGKNLVTLALTLLLAGLYPGAPAAVIAFLAGALAGVAIAGRRKLPSGPPPAAAPTLASLARYAVPLVLTALCYVGMLFLLRSAIAARFGLEEAGRFSLALDFGMKLIMTIGSGLDLLLFQLAVRTEAQQGTAAARQRLAVNAALVLALLLPVTLGLWLVLPSLEALLIAQAFRGGFDFHIVRLLPGLLAMGLIYYALHPFAQIERRTGALLPAGIAALGVAAAAAFAAPTLGPDAYGWGMTAAAAAAALLLLAFVQVAFRPPWPLRGLAAIAAGTVLMLAATLPLRGWPPGALTLALTVAAGVIAYAVPLLAADAFGLRRLVLRRGARAPDAA